MLARQLSRIRSHGLPLTPYRPALGPRALRLAQSVARSTNAAAAAAEDPNPDPWDRTLPNTRDEHDVLAAFVDDLAHRLPPTEPPSRTEGGREATCQPPAGMKKLDDVGLAAGALRTGDVVQKVAPQAREAPEVPRGPYMTTQTILQDLVNNRDRPLADEKFNEYAAFISACERKDLAGLLSKLLMAEDERFGESRQAILDSAWRNGHKRVDIEHWLSILNAPTSDAMVDIFLSRGTFQPTPLLNFLLRPAAVFTERSTLVSLLQYTATWYAEGSPPSGHSESEPLGTTIYRLSSHCCRSWPDLLPVVARVVATHIQSGIANIFPQHQVYSRRTTTYNYYLQLFATVPDRRALQYMAFIWEAQRVLLTMSSELQEPLILEKKSFDAIRLVLLGLRKTDAERDAAQRWGRTWPPYKIIRDGLDEQKDPEDEYTRPIQAGITMQESGYARQPIDDLIDTLAGMAPDGTPTIQHRANILKLIKHGHKVGGEEVWATKIRATRNAHEAWLVFQHPPPDWPCRCGPKVYAEMFKKLTAETANTDHYLPGDGRFSVEVHIPNLSDFEKARRQPPSVEQLYSQMLDEGIRPNGHCLTVLLQSTSRLRDFNKYLHHSTLDDDVVEWLTGSGGKHVPEISDRLPFGVLQAYVKLLCHRQPRATTKSPPVALRKLIPKAVRLVMEYADSARTDGRRFIDTRPLWTMILERVCEPIGVYFSERSIANNFFQTLLLYIDVLHEAQKAATPNDDMFLYTAIALRHATRDQFRKSRRLRPESSERKAPPERTLWAQLNEIREEAVRRGGEASIWDLRERYAAKEVGQLDVIVAMSRYLTMRFWQMSAAVAPLVAPDGTEYPMPARLYQMRGTEVHVYMQTLGQLGDYAGMVRLLGWIAESWGAEVRVKDRYHFTRAVACFRVLGEVETRRALRRAGAAEGGVGKVGGKDEAEEGRSLAKAEPPLSTDFGSPGEDTTGPDAEVATVESPDDGPGAVDEAEVERIRQRLRDLGAWPDLEQVMAYLVTTGATTEMFEVLLRLDEGERKAEGKSTLA